MDQAGLQALRQAMIQMMLDSIMEEAHGIIRRYLILQDILFIPLRHLDMYMKDMK